eukprot:8749637-Karenia_brevis.AAC.1
MRGLKAGIPKAHRCCRIWRPDQRWQMCRTRDGQAWVNLVGTAGVRGAGYWWARLGAARSRVV